MSRHTATISTELTGADGWAEIFADVSFKITPGWYADRDEKRVEDMKVERLYRRKRFGKTESITHELECPRWLDDLICDHADLSALMSDAEDDADGDACDAAYELARDRRMEAEMGP